MSFFETVEMLPDDPIMSIAAIFKADKREKKVNLGIGAYQDEEGLPFVLSSVKTAESILLQNRTSKEYLPIAGDANYILEALKLVYGADSSVLAANEVFGVQTIGGSGALRLGSEFLAQECGRKIYISDPSWPNHKGILTQAGFKVETYTYYDEKNRKIDFERLCSSIKKMSPGTVVLFQPCCHNPTGVDLTFEQWQVLSDIIKTLKVFPFFDLAYQGFGQGLNDDVKPIRYFVEQGHQLMVAQSFSKNFGLYGERAGVLSIVTRQAESAKRVGSKMKHLIRESYSNPPMHGAKIVSIILQDPILRNTWELEVQQMKNRIQEMRQGLANGLIEKCPRQDFSFLKNQRGMFSFSGLNQHQVARLKDEFGIYIVWNGRINIAGLNPKNLDYTIDSISVVLR
jgi:aspartate aminotransferase